MQLIFNIADSIQLLPHFLTHYTRIGFTRFHIGVYRYEENPLFSQIKTHCSTYDYTIEPGVMGEFTGGADSEIADRLRSTHVKPSDWYGIADLDEFFEISPFPSLAALIDACRAVGARAVVSELYDRIAADGSIPAALTDQPLEKQFPLGCLITKNIAGGFIRKIILARGDVPVTSGHHSTKAKALRLSGKVHHYKWHGDLVERLQRRAAIYKRLGLPWAPESERILNYLAENNGRIPV